MTNEIPERFRRRIQEAKEQHLEGLDLSNNLNADSKYKLTEIPEEIFELTHLKVLKLNNNKISSLPESLDNLTNLTELYLWGNQLTNLPESLGCLTKLTKLYLSENQLKILPKSLGNLTNLTELNLSRNQLTTLPKSLGNLTNLTKLNLFDNQLKTLPESLGNLTNLTGLYLSRNQLTTLPESLGNLTNLTELYLWGNQLTTLPESLGNLTNLTKLHLSKNQLTNLPESLGNLTNLTELDLWGNQLKILPESLGNLTNLTELDLDNNPLIEPPLEVANQGIVAIRDYFRQIKAEGLGYIYEAKLLIVGEPGAGKTTLAKKIDNPHYQLQAREPSTEGIDIIKYTFPCLDAEQNQREFTVNIWDFGGQEIYHATHQFFLTKRSLYALVADTRKEDTDFYYWLNVVELFSENSPLLIIKNEKQNRQREINETALRGQFKNLEKTLATNLDDNRGLEEILIEIKHHIQQLPHVGQILPRTWVKVRQTLEQDERNYISLQEYLDICENNGFNQHEDKLQLSGYLHDLGICLHFQDEEDSLLYKTVILKPEWGTDAVYKVLDNKQVVNNQGRFTRNDLKNIWHEEKYALMRGELLELMKKFQLCYQITGNKNTFIAPQLISENQPKYPWDESNNLILRYTYPDFMPKGIVTRFIVAMHQNIDQQKYVWKSGVILSKDNTKAEVIEYYGKREIRIRVVGNNKRDFLTVISHELDKINSSYKRLKYQKLIPCNCKVCKDSQEPFAYEFKELFERYVNKKFTIECRKYPYQEVQVWGLIDNAIDIKQLIPKDQPDLQDYQKIFNFKGDIQQLVVQFLEKGDISGDFMSGNRNLNMGTGDYTEQSGSFGIGVNKGTTNIDNLNVNTNEPQSQSLAQAAAEIQQLLQQLEQTNPTTTNREKMVVVGEVVDQIESDSTLKARVINALKTGGTEAFKEAIDHPFVNILMATIEGWRETE